MRESVTTEEKTWDGWRICCRERRSMAKVGDNQLRCVPLDDELHVVYNNTVHISYYKGGVLGVGDYQGMEMLACGTLEPDRSPKHVYLGRQTGVGRLGSIFWDQRPTASSSYMNTCRYLSRIESVMRNRNGLCSKWVKVCRAMKMRSYDLDLELVDGYMGSFPFPTSNLHMIQYSDKTLSIIM